MRLVNLMVVIISQCIHILNHHIVHLLYSLVVQPGFFLFPLNRCFQRTKVWCTVCRHSWPELLSHCSLVRILFTSFLPSLLPTKTRVWSFKRTLLPEPQRKKAGQSTWRGEDEADEERQMWQHEAEPPESTPVHNLWSDWGLKFEKPGARRFTAKPDCWRKILKWLRLLS